MATAADFPLPGTLPPGNTFPAQAATELDLPIPKAGTVPSNLKLDTRQVIIAVTEAPPIIEILPPPPARLAEPRPSTPVRNVSSSLPDDNGVSNLQSPLVSRSQTSSPMPVQNGGDTPNHQSPVMRSMFPRFDPSLPLDSQQYYPTVNRAPPAILRQSEAAQYSPSMYSQPRSPPSAGLNNPWAASRIQSTLANSSPLRISEEPPPNLSTGEQLLDLWTIANGQDSPEAAASYNLGLRW